MMKRTRNKICILQEAETKKETTTIGEETILAILMLSGVLFALQDIGYSTNCLQTGLIVGILVILVRQISERWEKMAGRIRSILYILGIGCFVLTARWLTQGFLFMVSRTINLWNLRFGTEADMLSTTEMAGTGAVILWGLAALCLASFILSQLKKKNMGSLLLLGMLAFAFSTILGQSEMWATVLLLIPAILGLFMLYSYPGKHIGIRGGIILGMTCLLIVGICFMVSGYRSLGSIEEWKYKFSRTVEKIRYGEDSLPQGNLKNAAELLDGKVDRLEVTMESPQELYLRGYVGADYRGTYWATVPLESYQGDYDGMLGWLSQKGFEPVVQYGRYAQLTEQIAGNTSEHEQVQILNKGAYRKYLYLPTSAYGWSSGEAKARKDWQVQSHNFFGSSRYLFNMTEGAGTAEAVYPASWLENPSGEEADQYLDAEAVYHSFAEDNYMEVSDELEPTIREFFFSGEEDLSDVDFTELTTQIRKALRTETDYTDRPRNPSNGEDTIRWFLTDYKEGNALYYASAAVMAYRLAGYPARYVEGYHLPSNEAETLKEEGKDTAELTTKNAHAWAEVYMTGIGWLPVEVVPGMYVETYSNQVMEGRAAYQVNVSPGENGLGTDQGGSESVGSSEGRNDEDGKAEQHYVAGIFVLILYFVFGIYLLLELQRAMRLKIRKKRKLRRIAEGGVVSYYVEEVESLMKIAGVKIQKERTEENWDSMQQKLSGITREELRRAVELVQKEQFGGIELQAYEYRTLESLAHRIESKLYQSGTWFRKLLYRYVWVLKNRNEI